MYADFDGGDTFQGVPEDMGEWAEKSIFPAVVSYAKKKGWLHKKATPKCFVSSKNRPGKASYHLIVSNSAHLLDILSQLIQRKAEDLHFLDNRALSVFWKMFWNDPDQKTLREESINFFGGQERFRQQKTTKQAIGVFDMAPFPITGGLRKWRGTNRKFPEGKVSTY